MKPIYYLIHSISFGDTLAATPTLRYLSQSHEQRINVVTHNTHIFKNNPHVDSCISFIDFESVSKENIIKYESFTHAGRRDGNGIEKKFSHIDLRQIHAFDLGFQLMPHQMEYDYFADPVELPYDFPETYVVCHITQNWPNRTWPTEKWQKFVDLLATNKIFTVLVGKDHSEKVHDSISVDPIVKKCPKLDNLYGLDLSNKLDLDGMYHVINGAKVLVTMCSGAMNIGGCTDTHILQIGSAQNPLLRIPYRNNTQNYKYDFVGGSCSIFCNMDLRYNVKEWGDINSVPPLTECPENKPTYECQPNPEKIMSKLLEILKIETKDKFLDFFEFLPDSEEDRINFNFKKTTDDEVKIVIKDIKTGLTRDKFIAKCKRLTDGNYWWAPMPGKVKNLGPIDLEFYLNGEFYGRKRIQYPGGKEILISGKNLYMDYLEGNEYPTFWEIFINGDYEKEKECVVKEGDVVLDIGANYGFFTLDSVSKGASKVYSIEPYYPAFEHLEKLSSDYSRIIPINKAVSEEDGEVFMHFDSDASATNCVTAHSEMFGRPSSGVPVESVSINTLLSSFQEKINFLKIDCEGSEFEIFRTITSENLRSIDRVVVETHGEEIDSFVHQTLLDNSFKVYKYDHILFATNLN
jgi:hypothetical protein